VVVRAGQLFTQLCLQGSIIFIPLLGGLIAQGWGYRGVMFFAAALGMAGMMAAVPKQAGMMAAVPKQAGNGGPATALMATNILSRAVI